MTEQGSADPVHGSCLCGSVAFEIDPPFPRLYQCHCSLCRKQGGSTSNTGMIVATEKFRWVRGQPLITEWMRPTGFRSYFCSICGAPVPNPLRDTGYMWVASGLIDDGGTLEIAAQLWTGSRAPWDRSQGGGKEYETAPDLRELIRLLHTPSG